MDIKHNGEHVYEIKSNTSWHLANNNPAVCGITSVVWYN